MIKGGYTVSMGSSRCSSMATNPETKRTEVIPFEFDVISKSIIARVIISKDPELSARVVNKILEKVDKHQN